MISSSSAFAFLFVCILFASTATRAVAQEVVFAGSRSFSRQTFHAAREVDSLTVMARRQAVPAMITWHDPVTNLPGDWAGAGSRVFRVSSVPTLAGLAALTGALVLTDAQTYPASKHLYDESHFVHRASDALVGIGDGSTHLGLAAAFGLYGFVQNDKRALRTAAQTIEAMLATGITVQVLKRISGRESPASATRDCGTWRLFPNPAKYQKNQPRYYAFPSGHIATTMATLTVIAENYPEQAWIRPVGYVILAGVGVSLVNVRYHWYSDLPLGIALGYTFGMVVSHHNDDESSPVTGPQQAKMVVQPVLRRDGGGVTMTLVF